MKAGMENGIGTLHIPTDSLIADITYENDLNAKLDKMWIRMAENELSESDACRFMKLRQLKEKIIQDKSIPNSRRDDAFLLRFLRAKKFDVDKSFRMIQKYLKMKNESPDLFRVSPVSEMHDLLKMQMQEVLPNFDANGSVVYIFRIQNCDPHKCSAEKVFRSNLMALENAIRDPRTQIGGLVVLLDMAGLKFAHAKFLSPHLAKRSAEVIQDSFPMRFKAFHIMHEPFYFDAILALVKPFMTEKIRNRIHTHGKDLKSLHRHIPKDILPSEYGGTRGAFDNTKWREQIIGDEDYFIRLETYSCDPTQLDECETLSKTNNFNANSAENDSATRFQNER